MTLSDILRFFSGAADGQRMGGPQEPVVDSFPAQSGVLAAPTAGGGRGFVNPPMANPSAPLPQNALTPLEQASMVQSSPVAAVMTGASEPTMMPDPVQPVSYANPSDAQMVNVPGATPIQQASGAPQGILARMGFADGNQAMMALGGALAAAGSQDPAKTALAIQQQRAEEAKQAAERRSKNKPKVEPLSGTPFFLVTNPDGSTQLIKNEDVEKFLKDRKDTDINAGVQRILLQGQVTQANQQAASDRASASEARPLLNDVQSLRGRWSDALGIVAGQGMGAQVQGAPIISTIAGFFGGDEVASNKFLQSLAVDETLLNTAKTKGAISNAEMDLFKSPIPSLTDDREKVWKPFIEQRIKVLDKLEKFYAGQASRGERAPTPGAPAAPAPAAPAPAAPARGGMAVPGLSPRASQYFQ
jgi:hypothetical protein